MRLRVSEGDDTVEDEDGAGSECSVGGTSSTSSPGKLYKWCNINKYAKILFYHPLVYFRNTLLSLLFL